MITPVNTLNRNDVRNDLFICLIIILLLICVYWQVNNFEFISFDDNLYVKNNEHVNTGLNLKNISWAFSFSEKNQVYWHPVTWLSHMLDCELYGLNPGMHHRNNLLFHVLNSLLLFIIFKQMTGEAWKSAVLAAFFALHPLNVESVAWVAERKNVLSTFLGLISLYFYMQYVQNINIFRYLAVFLFFALGLMAKPMLITLPFVFLLLDFWPLNRMHNDTDKNKQKKFLNLIFEKIPFFILSAMSVYISLHSLNIQYSFYEDLKLVTVPMSLRIENAMVSYVLYIWKFIWPVNLAVYYPFPKSFPLWQPIAASLLLICISFLLIFKLRKYPYLFTGWLWFMGTLVPVIGIKQAGLWPAMADRWAYVPMTGILIIIIWAGHDLFKKLKIEKTGAACVFFVLLLYTVLTYMQTGYWKNSISIFEHTANVTSDNVVAHVNLGMHMMNQGKVERSVFHYSEALRLQPDNEKAYNNLGFALAESGRFEEAVSYYKKALQIYPEYAKAHNNLGVALAKQGHINKAIIHFSEALRLSPGYLKAEENLKLARNEQEKIDQETYNNLYEMILKNPDNADAHYNLGNLFLRQKKFDKAAEHFLKGINIRPDDENLHNNLGIAYVNTGDVNNAVVHFQKALQINPDFFNAKKNLEKALVIQKNKLTIP